MGTGSLTDLYLDELCDAYEAERLVIVVLPRLADATRAPALRAALMRHCDETRLHRERLELIFTHWALPRRSGPCTGLTGIVQEADRRLNEPATESARDAAIIGIAQRLVHYEIAVYSASRTFARWLNRLDDARLLEETIDEQRRADQRLTAVAEAEEETISAA